MNKKNIKLIGFAGRKRSGKTELAKYMKEKDGAVIITVASFLKKLCCELLSCDLNTLNQIKDDGTTFKQSVTSEWVSIINKRTGIPSQYITETIGEITFINVRQMLQVIGTDLIRKYCPNWHVEQMINEIKSYSNDQIIVIDDVRFPNEKKAIETLGGEVIFLIRTSDCLNVSQHKSEISLSWQDFSDTHILFNEANLRELQQRFNSWFYNNKMYVDDNVKLYTSQRNFGIKFTSEIEDVITNINEGGEAFNKFGVFIKDDKKVYNPFITENLKRWL